MEDTTATLLAIGVTVPLAVLPNFEQAIKLDPNYAPAWAVLARVRDNQVGSGDLPIHEGTSTAREALTEIEQEPSPITVKADRRLT